MSDNKIQDSKGDGGDLKFQPERRSQKKSPSPVVTVTEVDDDDEFAGLPEEEDELESEETSSSSDDGSDANSSSESDEDDVKGTSQSHEPSSSSKATEGKIPHEVAPTKDEKNDHVIEVREVSDPSLKADAKSFVIEEPADADD
eukprot:GHVN01073087.1.p4 GENE.GHVN01073087.1~~GHVN01073087.1.p4  ORF type:complete len:144 (-),score=42.77 GHVN01073087.1:1732-2163(-)